MGGQCRCICPLALRDRCRPTVERLPAKARRAFFSTPLRTSTESMTIRSQSPGWDCSTNDSPVLLPSYSLTFTLALFASSKGLSRFGSEWSHQASKFSSSAAAVGVMINAVQTRTATGKVSSASYSIARSILRRAALSGCSLNSGRRQPHNLPTA
jgi:hypothetical protein